MRPERGDELVIVHVDESCLGNGQEPSTPGGAGGLVEVHAGREAAGLLQHLMKDGRPHLDFDDPIVSEACLTHAGDLRYRRAGASAG